MARDDYATDVPGTVYLVDSMFPSLYIEHQLTRNRIRNPIRRSPYRRHRLDSATNNLPG